MSLDKMILISSQLGYYPKFDYFIRKNKNCLTCNKPIPTGKPRNCPDCRELDKLKKDLS